MFMASSDNPGLINKVAPKFYLALGDSYTIGEAVKATERFPELLVYYLHQQKINFAPPEIIAATGWTTADLLQAIAESPPVHAAYALVTLLIGVNNQYQQRPLEEYETELVQLVKLAVGYAGGHKKNVVVLSIPDYGVTPFAADKNPELIAASIAVFNQINKKIANQFEVQYVDITLASRLAATDPSLIASDGLHPSGLAYLLWASMLLAIMNDE